MYINWTLYFHLCINELLKSSGTKLHLHKLGCLLGTGGLDLVQGLSHLTLGLALSELAPHLRDQHPPKVRTGTQEARLRMGTLTHTRKCRGENSAKVRENQAG